MSGIRDAAERGTFGTGRKASVAIRASQFPGLVKGYGLMHSTARNDLANEGKGGLVRRETDDPNWIANASAVAEATLKKVIEKGLFKPHKVTKGMYGPLANAITFMNQFSPQAIMAQATARQWSAEIGSAIGKNFSLTSPLSQGFLPYDLIPFVRTIYPVYTPLRNKLPRVPGQGKYHEGRILSSITGSLPGGLGSLQDDSTSEFWGGSFASWPNSLPNAGSQTAYDIQIPYRFFALTEGVSWLAQFSGQGYDDIYGLSSLVLLQEFMLLEEHDLLASSSQALATPSAPTGAARSAGTGEVGLSGVTTDVYAKVTAINFWGQTAASSAVTISATNGQVIDLTLSPVAGALNYVIYLTTGASPGTYYQFTGINTLPGGTVGATKFTLQGAIPTSGNTAPASDTGTSATTRQESLFSVLSGLAYNGGSGPYPNTSAGYYNDNPLSVLNVALVQTTLQQMYNGSTGYLANPSEIIVSANDVVVLANSIQAESIAAYQLRIQQSEMAGVTAGIAVAGVVNPIWRTIPEIVVHPYLPQGNCLFMSYTLPQTQNNLGNVVENVMVQDYAQIAWPVIDPTFRQSIMRYGTFFFPAPQYCGAIQGLMRSSTTPYF